jgi:Ca2+-binding RTX toxin-like protein
LDANDRVIYNNATGALFYDADGTGAIAAVQFAEVTPSLALTNLDFLVV